MASQEDSRSAPEFQGGRVSRRGFIGHIGGLYTAIAITSGTAVTVSFIASVINRHRVMWDAVGQAMIDIDFPSRALPPDIEERRARYRVARDAEEGALRELLAYKPTTMEECAERLRYLRSTVWDGCMPEEWEWDLLVSSMSA